MESNGFYVIVTSDRRYQLKRMLKSLRKFHQEPAMIQEAQTSLEAHHYKTRVGELAMFANIVMLDIDILVNGDLSYLFDVAARGKLGIYYEKTAPVFNSGVMAMNAILAAKLSEKWTAMFDSPYRPRRNKYFAESDQHALNMIIKQFPVEVIPKEYNYILKEHTYEQELEDFNKVKIFHFLRHGKETTRKSKAWDIWKKLSAAPLTQT